MLRVFTLIVFVFSIGSVMAQERWGSYETTIAGGHFQLIETCHDSVELDSGVKAEKLYVTTGFPSQFEMGRIVEGDSVFLVDLMNDQTPYLLYNFGLGVGDSIEGIFGDRLEVIEVRTEFILGKTRRVLFLLETEQDFQDTWVEGIGSIKHGYFQPGIPDLIFDAGSDFSCYYSKEFDEWYFSDQVFNECLADSINSGCFISSTDIDRTVDFKVFPNPATDILNIQIPTRPSEGITYQIFDTNGRGVLSDSIIKDSQEVIISSLEQGIYFVKIFGKDIHRVEKFVKK